MSLTEPPVFPDLESDAVVDYGVVEYQTTCDVSRSIVRPCSDRPHVSK